MIHLVLCMRLLFVCIFVDSLFHRSGGRSRLVARTSFVALARVDNDSHDDCASELMGQINNRTQTLKKHITNNDAFTFVCCTYWRWRCRCTRIQIFVFGEALQRFYLANK